MEYFWRTFFIALLLAIFMVLWNEKEYYKDAYAYQKNANVLLNQYNRSLEDSNINILNSCTDSIIAKIK